MMIQTPKFHMCQTEQFVDGKNHVIGIRITMNGLKLIVRNVRDVFRIVLFEFELKHAHFFSFCLIRREKPVNFAWLLFLKSY